MGRAPVRDGRRTPFDSRRKLGHASSSPPSAFQAMPLPVVYPHVIHFIAREHPQNRRAIDLPLERIAA
jgi:hypothetical protein